MKMIWLILAVILAVVEAATYQFVSIWFACGAVCAMVAAFFTQNPIIQLAVFAACSVIFLIVSRPLVKRFFANKICTNSDSLIGKTAVLTEAADNDSATGTLRISGIEWTARSEDGQRIEQGEKVVIVKIEGVKLIVRKEG